jgi:FAD/FMN-containing dehydrogenase
MWPIFQGKTCMARNNTRANDTCTLGSFPEYAVNVSNSAQIQLAVNLARNLNIRLVVKNTGHDYLGKSTGAGSLSIWTHNIKDITFFPDFELDGYVGKAFKVGAGVTTVELYRAAEAHNVTVMGSIAPVSQTIHSTLRKY